ncbi:MAG: hypothetical protein HQL01_05970 [Nitrospirae bacterium]|nr:hypothetical protein [Nitrospirota bacterium]
MPTENLYAEVQQQPKDNYGIYPMANNLSSGEDLKVLLILPKSDEKMKRWSLYYGTGDKPIGEGVLKDQSEIVYIKKKAMSKGKYQLLLIIKDEKAAPVQIKSTQIIVNNTWFSDLIVKSTTNNIGSLMGFILGLLAVPISTTITNKMKRLEEDKVSKEKLKSTMLLFIDDFIKDVTLQKSQIDIPEWMKSGEWIVYLANEPYMTIVSQIKKYQESWIAKIVDPQEIITGLQEIKDKLSK